MYNYSQKGREVLIFMAIRLSAVIALLILGGIPGCDNLQGHMGH